MDHYEYLIVMVFDIEGNKLLLLLSADQFFKNQLKL